jgi:hypothetical protein
MDVIWFYKHRYLTLDTRGDLSGGGVICHAIIDVQLTTLDQAANLAYK